MQVRDLIEELKRFDPTETVTLRVLIPPWYPVPHNGYSRDYKEVEIVAHPTRLFIKADK